MFTHNFCYHKDKSNFVYVLVHRNIRMYNINLHTIYLCRYASNICSLFSINNSMKYTPPPLHMRKIILVLNKHHFCYVEVQQTSDNTIVSNE